LPGQRRIGIGDEQAAEGEAIDSTRAAAARANIMW